MRHKDTVCTLLFSASRVWELDGRRSAESASDTLATSLSCDTNLDSQSSISPDTFSSSSRNTFLAAVEGLLVLVDVAVDLEVDEACSFRSQYQADECNVYRSLHVATGFFGSFTTRTE